MTTGRLGILGGTFDPIHRGHVDAGRAANAALGFGELLVVASNVPPHRPQPIASAFHRFAMVSFAVADVDGWRASDVELRDPARSYTSATLARFHEEGWAPHNLFFILGADAFLDIESWKDFPAILDAAHFAIVSRPGVPVAALPQRLPALAPRMTTADRVGGAPSLILIDAPTADVSSTAIRARRAAGAPITRLVPPGVAEHIERHRLYAAPESAAGSSLDITHQAAGRLHGQD